MAIWDGQGGGDPMKMLLLASMAQGLGRSLSKSTNTNYYGQQPQGGGGMEGMLPEMMRMQQLQAQMANQNADNELQRQELALKQQQWQTQQQDAAALEKAYGLPEGAMRSFSEQLGPGLADRLKRASINGRLVDQQTGAVVGEFPEYVSTDIGPMNKLTGQIDPNQVLMQFGLNRARSGATNVNVSPTAIYGATQGAFDQEIYKESGKAYVGIQKEAEAARKMAQDFRQIDTLLGETPTGEGFDQWRLKFAKAARGLGIPVDEKQIATKEAAEGLVNQFALGARSPDGPLGGLPGATSDRDIEFLRAIPPGIEQTPQGRKLMVEAQEAKAEHRSKRAAAAREYIRGRNGEVDPVELDAFKAAYDKEHPIYGGLADKWQGRLGQPAAAGGADLSDVDPSLHQYFTGP